METAPHPQDGAFDSLRKATPFSPTLWRHLIKINLFLRIVSPLESHKAAPRNSGLLGAGRARGDFALSYEIVCLLSNNSSGVEDRALLKGGFWNPSRKKSSPETEFSVQATQKG